MWTRRVDRSRLGIVVMAVAALLTVSGCASGSGSDSDEVRVDDAGAAATLGGEFTARLAAARDKWREAEPESWSATIEWIDMTVTDAEKGCGDGPTFILVEAAEVVEAIDRERDCAVGDPLTIEGLFDRASEVADAVQRLSIDDEYGFPTALIVVDDTIEVQAYVSDFRVREPDRPEPARDDLAAARQRWADVGVEEYRMVVELSCQVCPNGPVEVEVVAGDVVSLEPQGPEVATDALDFRDLSVDGIFDDIAATITTGDVVEATYDPEFGHPVTANLDPDPVWVDEERVYKVTEFEPAGS